MTILGGPNELIQTIYHDEKCALEAIAICETTGRIAVAEAARIHVYQAFGEASSLLKAGKRPLDKDFYSLRTSSGLYRIVSTSTTNALHR